MAAGEGSTQDRAQDRGIRLEDNKARVRRYVEEFQSAGKEETADALVAPDIIHHHGPGWTRADTTGREGAKAFISGLGGAAPPQARPGTRSRWLALAVDRSGGQSSPTTRLARASTTVGSNWVPAQRRSSATASGTISWAE